MEGRSGEERGGVGGSWEGGRREGDEEGGTVVFSNRISRQE